MGYRGGADSAGDKNCGCAQASWRIGGDTHEDEEDTLAHVTMTWPSISGMALGRRSLLRCDS